MRIAMIGHKRIPSREGGVEVHVEELAVRLAAYGHDVTVYNRKEKSFSRRTEYKGVKIDWITTLHIKGLEAALYSFFATVHALFGHYDAVHFHAEGPCAMLWLPHLFGIRTVATIHGLDWRRAKWGRFAAKFLLYGERNAAQYADEIIVLSQNAQRYFQREYGRTAQWIPNGVNPPVPRAADLIKSRYGLTKNSYLLFLARIVPEKGLHYLLDAYSQIDTEKKLVIAGADGQSGVYFQEICQKAAKDSRVIMTGFVEGAELEELYSNAFLYVLPSDVEGMAISLLEAMGYGCPCLVSDLPENSEVVGDCGYTFQKGNPRDLQCKLELLLKEPLLAETGERARSRVLKNYSWDEAARKTEQCYRADKGCF